MSFFIEDSTLGMLIENNRTEDGEYVFDKKYEELTRWEKVKYYLLIGLARTLISLTMFSAAAGLLAVIKLISWYNMSPEKLAAYQEAFMELTGLELNAWIFMLIEFLGWFCLVLVITIPLKLIRLIVSFIYYRKRL